MADTEAHHATGGRSRHMEISNLVVGLLHEYTGRGPTKARTHMCDNLICVVLEDTLTKGEQSLVRDGHADHVLNTRKAYQYTMRERLVAGVEAITSRHVVAFMSDNHINPDFAAEIFVLAPAR